jgi:hypothetical protein
MKKFLILGGIAASMVAPAPAHAASYQVGTADCFVQVDVMEPNLVICGGRPPCFTLDPEGSTGASLHCPPLG